MATTNLSAQTYNGGTWYSLYVEGEQSIGTIGSKTYNTFTPVMSNLSFQAKRSSSVSYGNLKVAPFVNDVQQNNVFDQKLTNSYATYTASITNSNSNKIQFYTTSGATLTKYFRNIKLPLAKHILLESGTYGTSSITVTDGNLATAEGYTSTNAYKIKLRSFLASGNITMSSSNSEFHFGGGATTVSLGVANNYCASANGSGGCGNGVLGHISTYYKDVYFSPSVQYNTTARSTTITITDGVNTAYVYLTAPVIPTYYFKAEAIAEPTTAGVATATFVNGQSTYSLVAPNVGTNSMSTDVTFAASAGANSVFEGWKKVAEDTYYKQGSGTESFTETITSSVLDPRGMASQKTYRAIFSERYTASMETNDISGLKVGGSATAVYSFINTSAAIPSSDENADFHYVITHRSDNTTKNGSADASKVVSFDPSTKQVVGLNSGSATITFVQKANANYVYVEKSFEVTVEKNDISAMIVKGDAVLNELVENAFSVTDGLQDYSVESLNSSIAEYVAGNKIQTYFTEGTAQFRVTRDEDYKYVGLNELFDLEVKKSEDVCYLVENASTSVDHEFGQNSNGTYSEVYTLNGIGDKLNFMCKLSDDADAEHYLVAQYSTSDTGDFYDLTGSYVSTKKDNEHVLNGLTLPEGTKRIRFKRTAQTIGTKNFSIYNIYVTRKKELDHQVAGGTLVLPQANMNQTSQKSFNLKWSSCADEILLVSNNALFEVSKTRIDASNGNNIDEVVVQFKGASAPGVYTATINIYDQTHSIELEVSCEVKAKLATEIIYTGEATYPETPDGIPYPFYVKDENGNTVQGAAITLETSNEDILSLDTTKIYPHCGGSVTLTATYAGNETHESCSLSVALTVPYCQREVVWNTSYLDFAVDANGFIDEKRVLDATINPESEITYQLHTVTPNPFAEIVEEGGEYFVRVFGEGRGYISAITNECLYEGQMYETTYKIKELRVSGAGACDPNSLLIWEGIENEPYVYRYSTNSSERTRIYHLTGLPAATMTFGAHAAKSSVDNRLVISFSTESEGDNWIGQHRQEVVSGSNYNWNYSCPVPEGAKRVRFQSEASLTIYFNGVTIPQQTYIRPSVESIEISDAIVNVPFERTFSVDYSNVRLLQWKVSDNHDLGLKVVANQEVNNDCDLYGTYTFTLTGESPYPQSNVTETITFFTSAGDVVNIPVTITATLSEPFYFNVQDGDMAVSSNWTYNGSNTHGLLPDKRFPIIVSQAMTINEGELVAYGVTIENGGSVNIEPNGGLTLHAGGFTRVDENNLVIHSNTAGSGFVRVSPFFTTKVPGTMPKAKINFTTKANMNAGDNRDAAWQYIGAPGSGASLQKEASTVLYLRSEQWGWLPYWNESVVALEPFAGYALTQKEQSDFIFQAQLINADQTIQLTYTEEGMKGDNLWANSYMAPIDIKKLGEEDFSGAVDQIVYLYNCGSWNEWNKDQSAIQTAEEQPGRYYAIPVGSARALDATYDQTVIPPMQGVYMVASKPGGGSLTLNYEKHVWNCTSDKMNQALRIAGKHSSEEDYLSSILRIRLQVNSQNSGADRMYLIQDATCTADYDNGFDAPKQMTEGLLNLYTNEACGKMEISATDHIDGMYLGFAAGEDDVYTMTFTSLIGDNLYLYDVEQDTLVGMYNGEKYEFAAAANSTNDMRFQILVNPDLTDYLPNGGNGGGVTTDTEDVDAQPLWVHDEKVYIAHASINSTLEVYTMSGVAIARYTIGYAPCTLDMSALPTGVYMLRLNDQVYKFVCK